MHARAGCRLCVAVVLSCLTAAMAGAAPTVQPLTVPVLFEPAAEADGSFVVRGSREALRITAEGRLVPAVASKDALRFAPHGCRRLFPEEAAGSHANYFSGTDPAKWRIKVRQFRRVVCEGAYPGIDLTFHGDRGQLELDYLVSPRADPGSIRLRFEGGGTPALRNDHGLQWDFGRGQLSLDVPRAFEKHGDREVEIEGVRYRVKGRTARLDLPVHDRRRPILIDPVISYSTYIGAGAAAYAAAAAPDGSLVLTGITEGPGLPAKNAVQPAFGGHTDAFVMKLDPAGDGLRFSTYLGGGNGDTGYGVAIDAQGNIYVAGWTLSSDFPVRNAHQATCGGCGPPFTGSPGDAFLVKLSPDGSNLLFSTFLGGERNDAAYALALDEAGNAYIAGATSSADFPVTAGALQSRLGTVNEPQCQIASNPQNEQSLCGNALIAKFDPSGTLVYATYFGGRLSGGATGIAVDSGTNAWIVGSTIADDFPTTAGAVQKCSSADPLCWNGFTNAFIAKVSATGSSLLYSTLLGTPYAHDFGRGIAIDGADNVYAGGTTGGRNFPVTPGALKSECTFTDSCLPDMFLVKFTAAGTLIYSTRVFPVYVMPVDGPYGLAADAEGNVYFAGFDTTTQIPAVHPLQSCTAVQGVFTGFVGAMNPTGSALTFSSCVGGPRYEERENYFRLYGFARDASSGTIFLAGSSSQALPTTPSAFQHTVPASARPNVFAMRIDPADRAQLALTSYSVQFGSSLVGGGDPGNATLVAFNLGSVPLPLELRLDGSDFQASDDCGSSIAAGSQCTIHLGFAPSLPGPIAGQLAFFSGSQQLAAVALQGGGAFPDITANPARLDFGSVPVGTAGSPLPTVFTNSAVHTPGTIYSIILSGDFSQTNDCNSAVPWGSPCRVNVTFHPSGPGRLTGSLTLYFSGYGSPAVVPLEGFGATTRPRRRTVRTSP